jgi:hypothetical protein
MSEPKASGGGKPVARGWDSDITDGRKVGEWESIYKGKGEVSKEIKEEAIYLAIIFGVFLIGVFVLIYKAYVCDQSSQTSPSQNDAGNDRCLFYNFLGAWIAGTLGGCSFGIKWMYHAVAKGLWHQDRKLWRLYSPHLAGVVSLFMVLLVSSGLLQMFDPNFSHRLIGVLAFSFLVGYFSDKALAKMADVAETLFGGVGKEKKKKKKQNEDGTEGPQSTGKPE